MTTCSGAVFQPAVDTGGLDIPALMRHAAIQGSIVEPPNRPQSSAHVWRLSCAVAALAAVERASDATIARNFKRRADPYSQEEVMPPDGHILARASDLGPARAKADKARRNAAMTVGVGPANAGRTTRGLFP